MSNTSPDQQLPSYLTLLSEVLSAIRAARSNALQAVNRQLIALYWQIGEQITKRQEQEGWGASVVEHLSKDIRQEFPGIAGFSPRNLWRMRDFYVTYSGNLKLSPLVAEISWSHNLLILEKCSDDLEREFYLKASRKFNWSKRTLLDQLEQGAYIRFVNGQTNFGEQLTPQQQPYAVLMVKDEYVFDFLELEDDAAEREVERELVKNIERFLAEMGGYFAFVGRQYRVEIDDEEFFIDLLLYHRGLRALVAVELKTGKFKPEYAGKMQFYLSVLNDRVKLSDEHPSVGIIICRSKHRTIVEYTLQNVHAPIGVAAYSNVRTLPEELRGLLPSPEEIAKRLNIFDSLQP